MKKALMMLSGVGLGAGLMYLFDPDAGARRRMGATTAGRWLGRALADVGLKRMLGIGASRRPVIVQKTMTIRAPVDRVFDFWTKYGNAPSFMQNVRNARITRDGRTRWLVFSPSGAAMGWDAKFVTQSPSKSVAWKATRSETGSEAHHAGTVRFIDNGDGTTTVNLRMIHYPPAQDTDRNMPALPDLKARLSEDLRHMKIAIESGIVPVEDREVFGTAESIKLQAS